MTIDLDKNDLINLVKGTGGPCTYTNNFNHIGELTGFPNEKWQWFDYALKEMTEQSLYDLYLSLLIEKSKH